MPDATRLPTDMFRFTFGERSGIYTAVLHVFGEANERPVLHPRGACRSPVSGVFRSSTCSELGYV
jgi:hypothetical protein